MLIKVSHELLKQLAQESHETAQLAVREGNHAIFIDSAISNQVITISGRLGELTPLHCTAHGKALILDYDTAELEAVFSKHPLEAYTKNTVTSVKQLAAICKETRKRGYATDNEEYVEGIRCVAAPVRAEDGQVIGAIGISAPLARFPEDRYAVAGKQVAQMAEEISSLLNYQNQED
jgi:IclR family transcriptional regulator, acetate operon repressor